MFRKYIFIIAAVWGFSLTGCEDVLDKKPLDKFSELDVWTDNSLAEGFVLGIYPNAVGFYATNYTDDWTDNIVCNDDNGARWTQAGSIESSADYGWNQYWRIRKCNLAIEKLTDNPEIDQIVSKHLIAEARMMRAMIYFWMARRFGGVMLVKETLTPDDELKLPRASERETYDFIIEDIQAAIPDLPNPDDAQRGRLSNAAAYAFLTQVALQIGDYDLVLSAADDLEDMEIYSLDPVYSNIFNSYEGTLSSPEVILVYDRNEDHTIYIDTRMFRSLTNCYNGPKLRDDAVPQYHPDDEFQGWPHRWPSQELVDDYLFIEDNSAVQITGSDYQGQPSRLFWENRDLRFEQSIVHDSAQYSKSIFTFRQGGNAHWTSNPLSTWGMSKSGYMFRKWMYEDQFFFWNYPVSWAEPLLRLSEVYLNKAEAYGRKGNLPKAIEYMNKTRTVHGGLPELPAGSSEEDFWKFYKIERNVEMAQEDDRYWSLIRWARAENAASIPELDGYRLHALDMEFDGLVNVVESPFTVDMKFEMPKRLFFPVPEAEIRQNENLTQNPGWN